MYFWICWNMSPFPTWFVLGNIAIQDHRYYSHLIPILYSCATGWLQSLRYCYPKKLTLHIWIFFPLFCTESPVMNDFVHLRKCFVNRPFEITVSIGRDSNSAIKTTYIFSEYASYLAAIHFFLLEISSMPEELPFFYLEVNHSEKCLSGSF